MQNSVRKNFVVFVVSFFPPFVDMAYIAGSSKLENFIFVAEQTLDDMPMMREMEKRNVVF